MFLVLQVESRQLLNHIFKIDASNDVVLILKELPRNVQSHVLLCLYFAAFCCRLFDVIKLAFEENFDGQTTNRRRVFFRGIHL